MIIQMNNNGNDIQKSHDPKFLEFILEAIFPIKIYINLKKSI